MRCPASLCMQTDAREATGQHRPSATTSGTCECTRATLKGTAHVQRPETWPGGPGANKPPRWSAERRASPGCAEGESLLRGDARRLANACGPTLLAREGCLASTRAPVGAPLPHIVRGHTHTQTRRASCLARRMKHVWTTLSCRGLLPRPRNDCLRDRARRDARIALEVSDVSYEFSCLSHLARSLRTGRNTPHPDPLPVGSRRASLPADGANKSAGLEEEWTVTASRSSSACSRIML
jgi:hypothetical protein